MSAKKPGKFNLSITGLLLIAAALGLTVYNLYENVRAMESASQVVEQLAQITPETKPQISEEETVPEETARETPGEMPFKIVNGEQYIGTIKLPKYQLALPVISQWSYPRLKIAPCRYEGSIYTDDLIISAHNYLSHFGRLVELEPGDEVLFTDVDGNTVEYVVVMQETLEETDISKMSAGDWDLTLFTCTVGGTYRVTVRCDRVASQYTPQEEVTLRQQHKHGDDYDSLLVEDRVHATESTEPMEEEDTIPVYTDQDGVPIPLYFQTDYPETMYGSGTVATSGCSVTTLAMVATYLTGHEYLPDELARYFGGRAENNMARLELGSETLKLPFEKAKNWHYAYEALQEGKVVILLVNNPSIFTNSQHFILLTGLTEEGKVLVHDPYRPNYDNWLLRKGFEEGFNTWDVIIGYDGAWIYDKEAMPEDPYIHFEPDIDRNNPRYPDIQLTYEERKLLAKVVWVEARGESAEGQQAVAEVILNRLASDRFPNTLNGVIYAEGQFRSVEFLDEAEPYQAQYEAIDRAMYGPYILPKDVYYFATFKTNNNVWGEIGGHIFCYAAD